MNKCIQTLKHILRNSFILSLTYIMENEVIETPEVEATEAQPVEAEAVEAPAETAEATAE